MSEDKESPKWPSMLGSIMVKCPDCNRTIPIMLPDLLESIFEQMHKEGRHR